MFRTNFLKYFKVKEGFLLFFFNLWIVKYQVSCDKLSEYPGRNKKLPASIVFKIPTTEKQPQ